MVVLVVIVMLVVREGLDLDMRGARRGGCYLIAIPPLIGPRNFGGEIIVTVIVRGDLGRDAPPEGFGDGDGRWRGERDRQFAFY